jgi:cell division protein FtsB
MPARLHVSPIPGFGGILVAAATQAAGSAVGLDAAVITGVFGTLTVIGGQWLQWRLNQRSRRAEAALIERYKADNDTKDRRIHDLETELDRRRRRG